VEQLLHVVVGIKLTVLTTESVLVNPVEFFPWLCLAKYQVFSPLLGSNFLASSIPMKTYILFLKTKIKSFLFKNSLFYLHLQVKTTDSTNCTHSLYDFFVVFVYIVSCTVVSCM
jgi:hypothetical protein